MKIRYKRKRLLFNLAIGVIWLVLGILGNNLKETVRWVDYGFIIISFLFIATYLYESNKQYLTMKNGFIQINQLFGKKMKLKDITSIRKFAGDYILETANSKLTINTNLIDNDSLLDLNKELSKLNL
jgi:hypothetical protein